MFDTTTLTTDSDWVTIRSVQENIKCTAIKIDETDPTKTWISYAKHSEQDSVK